MPVPPPERLLRLELAHLPRGERREQVPVLQVAGDPVARHPLADDPPALLHHRGDEVGRRLPYRRPIVSRLAFSPLTICPPFRPEAPQPTLAPSSTRTWCPRSASSSPADSPVKPAPTMQTSTARSPASAGRSGAGLRVAA